MANNKPAIKAKGIVSSSPKKIRPAKTAQEKRGVKAGFITFGGVFALYALLFPLYRIGDFILCAALSFLIGKVASIMASGLDLRTEEQRRIEEPEPIIITGDAQADDVIARGQEMIRSLRNENRLIPDETLSAKMEILESTSNRILKAIEEKPARASQVRRFMDYYLPTTLKMVTNYRLMDERELEGKSAQEVRQSIVSGMDTVNDACSRLLDSLYKDDYLDVSTDIDVLKQMLKRDGLTDGEFINVAAEAIAIEPTKQEEEQ
jgi:5-bromo-4-chloroindolyl phosphate hydrolysis protein.